MAVEKVLLPDIGDFEGVEVIELLVSPGDRVEQEQSLLVLESDKATMEIPSPFTGTVSELKVGVGDQVSEGSLIALMEVEDADDAGKAREAGGRQARDADGGKKARAKDGAEDADESAKDEGEDADESAKDEAEDADESAKDEAEDADESAKDGAEDADESAKAGARETEEGAEAEARDGARDDETGADERDEGEEQEGEARADDEAEAVATPDADETDAAEDETADADEATAADQAPYTARGERPPAHASPSVRRLARELGVDLSLVPGSGRKSRILKEDVQGFVKASLRQGVGAGVPIAGVHVAAPVSVDFEKFGPTETEPLNKVRRISAANLHRSWVTVPHVTQFDEADVTELEQFRQAQKAEAEAQGVKLTFLPFVIRACTAALKAFPHFNSSLDASGENLIVKGYLHVGVAVDTPHGLVVPVVRDADRKGLLELAAELQELSERARSRKLRPEHLQGGSFSISSLGGIGGTKFTPIVNHPEVAILGVSRMDWRPVWRDGSFVPRRILPLSLSYDHRVIDGADAARFTTHLAACLGDLRRVLL